MANCAICGKPLTNPASVARGEGPVCGGRAYMGRIMARYGHAGYGWSSHAEWEKVNNPCYSCRQFSIPGKGEETKQKNERTVSLKGRVRTFDLNAIGGFCEADLSRISVHRYRFRWDVLSQFVRILSRANGEYWIYPSHLVPGYTMLEVNFFR